MGFSRGLTAHDAPLLLSASANGRHLVDKAGRRFLIHGDTVWSGIAVFDTTDAAEYLDNCEARGFNTVVVNLIEGEGSASPPENFNGDRPYSSTMFQSSTVTAYFDEAERFIEQCADRGIVCLINPCYIGFNDAQGFGAEVVAASQAQMEAYATFVGNLLEPHDNIIYSDFGDRLPTGTLLSRVNAMRAALLTADTRHTLIAHHFGPDVSSHDSEQTGLTFDWIYRYDGYVHEDCLDGYNDATTRPVVFCEGWYEDENGSSVLDQRRQAWGALLSGACGQVYGHRNVWACGFNFVSSQTDTWQNTIANVGNIAEAREDMAHVLAFFSTRSWWLLVPDQTSTFITAGRGTITTASYVPAAFASDDSWGAAYLPTGSTGGAITVDRTEFSGAFSWTWFNPRTGGTSGGAAGVTNTGTQNFTAPDTNDWVWVGEVD